MNNLGSSYSCEVAIALIGKDYFVGVGSFHPCCYSRCSAVCYLDHIDIKVVIGQYCATYRGDADGAVAYVQLIDGLGYQSMCDTVPASGAVMRRAVFESRRSYEYRFHFR